jgi:hypothetical protein
MVLYSYRNIDNRLSSLDTSILSVNLSNVLEKIKLGEICYPVYICINFPAKFYSFFSGTFIYIDIKTEINIITTNFVDNGLPLFRCKYNYMFFDIVSNENSSPMLIDLKKIFHIISALFDNGYKINVSVNKLKNIADKEYSEIVDTLLCVFQNPLTLSTICSSYIRKAVGTENFQNKIYTLKAYLPEPLVKSLISKNET